MKMTKKALSIVLALVLAFSALAIMPSALAPDSAVDIYIRTDKTNYKPGEVIHLTISQQADPVVGMMQNAGVYPVAYNNVAIEPISDIRDDLEPHNFKYLQPGSDDTIDDLMPFDGSIPMEEAGAAKYGWNDSFIINSANDGVTEIDNTQLLDFYTFDLKVKADAPAGDYVIGFNQNSYVNYQGIVYDATLGGIAGWDDDNGYGTKTNYSLGTCTIHVGDDTPAGPVLNRTKTQVKANGADRFLLRTMNSISAKDFTELNGDADVIKNVVSAGFVVTTDATWDDAAAKAAIASGSTANYKVGKTNYFYKNPAGTYDFGCMLDAPLAQGTNFQYCAFIEYKDAQGAVNYLFYKDGAVKLTFEQVDAALKA